MSSPTIEQIWSRMPKTKRRALLKNIKWPTVYSVRSYGFLPVALKSTFSHKLLEGYNNVSGKQK